MAFGDGIEELRELIGKLRAGGDARSRRSADRIEQKLRLLETLAPEERLTAEGVRTRWDEVWSDNPEAKKGSPSTWPEGMREELFDLLQTTYAAASFRLKATGDSLGEDVNFITSTLRSSAYELWAKDRGRRTLRIAAVADLALARVAEILSLKSADPQILSVQARLAAQVFGGGGVVPNQNPGLPARAPEMEGGRRQLPAASTAPIAPPLRAVPLPVKGSGG